jgi:hypothetical protein
MPKLFLGTEKWLSCWLNGFSQQSRRRTEEAGTLASKRKLKRDAFWVLSPAHRAISAKREREDRRQPVTTFHNGDRELQR